VKCDCKAFAASLSIEITFVEVSAQGPQLIVACRHHGMFEQFLHVGLLEQFAHGHRQCVGSNDPAS